MAEQQSNMNQLTNYVKGYWQKPGGKLGTVLGAIALAVIGWKVWGVVIPKIQTMLDDSTELFWGLTKATCTMAICAFVVGGLLYAVFNPKFRQGIIYLWDKLFIDWWLRIFITRDPKKIAQGKIDEFKKEREKFQADTETISGDLESTQRELTKTNADLEDKEAELISASRISAMAVGTVSREIEFLKQIKSKLEKLNSGLTQIVAACEKIYDNSYYQLQDMQNEYKYTCKLYDISERSSSAFKRASQMFKGGVKSELGDQAMYYMEEKISQNIGSMRSQMKNISKFMEGVDIKNGAYDEKGLQMLQQINPEAYKSFQLNFGGTPTAIPASTQLQSISSQESLLG